MKKHPVFLPLMLCLVVLLCGCSGADTATADSASAAYTQVSPAEAASLMASEEDYIILDVRTQEEYNAGHIPGAVCIPNESIGTDEIPGLPDKDQLILVYCRSGRRSKEASQKLADLGYTSVVEFGGLNDWTGETVAEND